MNARTGIVAGVLLAAAALAQASAGMFPAGERAQGEGFVSRLDARAPGAFDAGRPARRTAEARYRADAQVLLPLLVTSIRIASRSGVGLASAHVRDVALASGERLLAFEFYAASIPERARGLDRLGFFREAVLGPEDAKRQTAYFGAMTVSKEQTLDEAKRAIAENPGLAAYDVIDGLVTREAALATSYGVTLAGRSPDAAAFFGRVHAEVDPAGAKVKPALKASPGRPLDGYSFLGAFEALLQRVAAAPDRLGTQTFVFGSEQRTVEVRGLELDRSRARDWAARGIVARPEGVRRLECRIVAPGWKVDFVTWIELPAAAPSGPAPFILPLRVEYQPRAFLRLVFEREH